MFYDTNREDDLENDDLEFVETNFNEHLVFDDEDDFVDLNDEFRNTICTNIDDEGYFGKYHKNESLNFDWKSYLSNEWIWWNQIVKGCLILDERLELWKSDYSNKLGHDFEHRREDDDCMF